MKHHQKAAQYAIEVVEGDIVACKAVTQACQRFINDLEKQEKAKYPYYFDVSSADHVCEFIELLPHTKGPWAAKKQRLTLEPWQTFILCNLFGWLDKKTKQRRFRKAYIQVARKNGKSILVSGVGVYMLVGDGEHGAEVYCGATNEKQALEVFTPARLMCESTPDLCSYYDVKPLKSKIIRTTDNSFFEPVIGNPKDGGSPHCGIVDEYHEHKDNSTVETFVTGMGARALEGSPLLLIITTSGHNIDGPCFDEYTLCKKVLDGSEEDERLFSIIYEIDQSEKEGEPCDDWSDPANLIKANPNMGVSVGKEYLEDQLKDAIKDPKKQNAFLTKHLNKWVNAAESWLSFQAWKKCAQDFKESDLAGWECMHAIDLASRCDIAAYVKTFFKTIDGAIHYRVVPKFFVPGEHTDTSGRYQKWIRNKYMIATDGEEIDFNIIEENIKADCKQYGAKEVPFDPWNATQLAQNLADDDLPVIEFNQTVKNMSGAMYEVEAAIKSGRLQYQKSPVLDWMISNIVVKIDRNDNIFPRKERNRNKIDGGVAMIMGVGRAMVYKDETTDFSQGLLCV